MHASNRFEALNALRPAGLPSFARGIITLLSHVGSLDYDTMAPSCEGDDRQFACLLARIILNCVATALVFEQGRVLAETSIPLPQSQSAGTISEGVIHADSK